MVSCLIAFRNLHTLRIIKYIFGVEILLDFLQARKIAAPVSRPGVGEKAVTIAGIASFDSEAVVQRDFRPLRYMRVSFWKMPRGSEL